MFKKLLETLFGKNWGGAVHAGAKPVRFVEVYQDMNPSGGGFYFTWHDELHNVRRRTKWHGAQDYKRGY